MGANGIWGEGGTRFGLTLGKGLWKERSGIYEFKLKKRKTTNTDSITD